MSIVKHLIKGANINISSLKYFKIAVLLTYLSACASQDGGQTPPIEEPLKQSEMPVRHQIQTPSILGAEIIDGDLSNKFSHLTPFIGAFLLNNGRLQVVIAGVDTLNQAREWASLILAVYELRDKQWKKTPHFKEMLFRRNWVNQVSTKTRIVAVIPSPSSAAESWLDVIFTVSPLGVKEQREFLRIFLEPNSKQLNLLIDDEVLFGKRSPLEKRLSFKLAYSGSLELISSAAGNTPQKAYGIQLYPDNASAEGMTISSLSSFDYDGIDKSFVQIESPGRGNCGAELFRFSFNEEANGSFHALTTSTPNCANSLKDVSQRRISSRLSNFDQCRQNEQFGSLALAFPENLVREEKRCYTLSDNEGNKVQAGCFTCRSDQTFELKLLPGKIYQLEIKSPVSENTSSHAKFLELTLGVKEKRRLDLP